MAKIRQISKLDYSTPILVPSFSSKGFPHIKKLHYYLREKLTDVSLISTYDLFYGYIDADQIYESDILIIDSGGYERNKDHDISEIYNSLYIAKEWNETQYEKQVTKLRPITDILLVNFDYIDGLPLKEQIQLAQQHFKKYPQFASDFLCKPTSKDLLIIDINNVLKNIHLFSTFDVLGFTEKELGNTIYERATNIYRIRKALIQAGSEVPIHVFGCLDPLSVILYFLCGADIFDGLSWLRFSFIDGTPMYINHYALNYGLWDKSDNEVKMINYLNNLEELINLKNKMNAFVHSSDWDDLQFKANQIYEVKLILTSIIKKHG